MIPRDPMTECLSPRLERWCAAWHSLDRNRIIALYSERAVHESPAVARLLPAHGGTRLVGHAQIAGYVAVACERLRSLRFEPFHVLEVGDVTVMEYRRTANDETSKAINVCEIVQWQGDKVIASRVYHA
jgi:hypothetical protein